MTATKQKFRCMMCGHEYDEMVDKKGTTRDQILDRFRKDANLTKSGALSYFHRFQKESGRTAERGPSKMDKARDVFDRMIE